MEKKKIPLKRPCYLYMNKTFIFLNENGHFLSYLFPLNPPVIKKTCYYNPLPKATLLDNELNEKEIYFFYFIKADVLEELSVYYNQTH